MDVSSTHRRGRATTAIGLLVVAGCGGSAAVSSDDAPATTSPAPATAAGPSTLPLVEHFLDEPEVTTVATDLAPSQATGSTVPEPPAPDRCGADEVEMWTAQVAADGSTAVIRMRNASDTWCDFDIGRSPRIDPAIEPDVWLQPDETADLVVGPSTSECTAPDVVDRIQVAIVDESVLVPTALVTCGWWLSALYPNDPAREPCDVAALDVVATAASVVVRNSSASACRLGGLDAVEGAEVATTSATAPGVVELLPGDVVSFGRLDGYDCDSLHPVTLVDGLVGRLEVPGVSCAIVFELGAAAPWFGTDVGPRPEPDGGPDASAAVAVLDPFASGQ